MGGHHQDITEKWKRVALIKFPPIEGSRLLRAACGRCGEQIRIGMDRAVACCVRKTQPRCRSCDEDVLIPHTSRASVLTPRQAECLKKTTGG